MAARSTALAHDIERAIAVAATTHHVNGPLSRFVAHLHLRARLQQHASGVQLAPHRCGV